MKAMKRPIPAPMARFSEAGIAHSEADREYEESVQTHTRSQSERFLGIDRHHECTYNGSQYGGSEYSVCIHALSGEMTEDVRVTARI